MGTLLGCLYVAAGLALWIWLVLNGYAPENRSRAMDDPITPLVGLLVMVLLWPVIFGGAGLWHLWEQLRPAPIEPLNGEALDSLRARYRTMSDDEIDHTYVSGGE